MDAAAEIIKKIQCLAGDYSGYEIFSDWIKAASISISNSIQIFHNQLWKDREEQYMQIVAKHGKDKMIEFANMTAMLAIELENDMRDVLGEVYMKAGLGSKETGQFFTPFHISYMTAKLMEWKDEPILINEPSTGGGGMMIAAAKAMKEKGIDYQKNLTVIAQDLDWKGVYMTYLQLSILGVRAKVIQGDTIAMKAPEPCQILYTPKWVGVI